MTLFRSKTRLPAWRRERKTAALLHRVVHVDLKGPKIPVPVFKRLLRQYARWGINGILVEYEHRLPELPFGGRTALGKAALDQFPSSDRYTRSEVGEWVNLSRDLGIEFIPLVQTMGHVEYLSRLRGASSLAENPRYPSQLCPSNAAVRDYLARLLDLMVELHPHSRRIHVGMDETHQLGHCPVCRRRMAELGGRMELYLDHVRWICGEVIRRGRRPMIWGDMFLGAGREDLISKLGPEVIVLPWDYACVTEKVPYALYKGNRPCKAVFRHDYTCASRGTPLPSLPVENGFADDLSPSDRRRFGGLDRSTGLAPGFVQGRLMSRLKRPLWGACAVDSSASGLLRPDFVCGLHNCNQMVRVLLELGGRGAVATVWARGHSFAPINSPWTLSLYGVAQFAASAWTGKTRPSDLRQRAAAVAAEVNMPGRMGDWTLDDLLWILSMPSILGPSGKTATLKSALKLLQRSRTSGIFAEALALSIRAEILSLELRFLLDEARWWHPNRADVPPVISGEMKTRLSRIQKEIHQIKPQAGRYYTKWVGEKDAFETWWRGLFAVDIELAKKALALVERP